MADYTSSLEIGDKIGNGHFGQVHRAQDRAHGDVAVKVLKRGATMNDEQWTTTRRQH